MSLPDLDYMMRSMQYDDYRQTAELDRQASHLTAATEPAEAEQRSFFEALLRRLTGQHRHSSDPRSQ